MGLNKRKLAEKEMLQFVPRLYHFAHVLSVCCLFVVLAGMEVAAALTDKAHSVSVIGIESVPFKKALGEKVGKAIMKVGTRSWEIKLFRTRSSSRILSPSLSMGRTKKSY